MQKPSVILQLWVLGDSGVSDAKGILRPKRPYHDGRLMSKLRYSRDKVRKSACAALGRWSTYGFSGSYEYQRRVLCDPMDLYLIVII